MSVMVAGDDAAVDVRAGMFTSRKRSNVLAGAPGFLFWQEQLELFTTRERYASPACNASVDKAMTSDACGHVAMYLESKPLACLMLANFCKTPNNLVI